jgi:hypothetical protein
MSAKGQKAKFSLRANVFRYSPKNGREQLQKFHKANCRNLIRAFDDRSHTCDSC